MPNSKTAALEVGIPALVEEGGFPEINIDDFEALGRPSRADGQAAR